MQEIYKRYRPSNLDQVIGQDEAVNTLKTYLKKKSLPHTILFSGPSGTGKTSLARILKAELQCGDLDYQEVACASLESPIDTIRSIDQQTRLAPISGTNRIWLLDECQSLSRSGFSLQSALSMFEDTPSHVYFLLCSTDPDKLITAVRSRCTEIKLKPLSDANLEKLLRNIIKKEKLEITESVIEQLIEVSEGGARKALVLLDQIAGLESEEEQLNAILKGDTKRAAYDLVKALVWGNPSWKQIKDMLYTCEEDPENLRRMIMGAAAKELLKCAKLDDRAHKAARIIYHFKEPFFHCGKPGLIEAVYSVMKD